MFNSKAKKIKRLESALKAASERADSWYSSYERLNLEFRALQQKELDFDMLKSSNLILADTLYKAEVQRDTFGQVLKQLRIPVKLK